MNLSVFLVSAFPLIPFCLYVPAPLPVRDDADKEADEPSLGSALGSAAFDVDNMQLSGLDLGPQVWHSIHDF